MKLRLRPRRRHVEPAGDEGAREEPTTERPIQPPAPPKDPEAAPALPGEPPAEVSLALEEAKTAIRAAGGDVIRVGFLARAYLRHREEEPDSAETSAARERLCELVGKRLKDRKLLAPEGNFELLEEPPARKHTA